MATYLGYADEQGMTVFNARLGLTVLTAIPSPKAPAARQVVAELHRRVTEAIDGYAAREVLTCPAFTALATTREAQDCHALLRVCALGAGVFPTDLHNEMKTAIRASDHVIRNSVAVPTRRQAGP